MNHTIASLLAQAEGNEEAVAAGIMAFFAAFAFVFIAIAVVVIIGMWKTFEKAGQPGWAAIIPFYNLVVMFRLGGQSGWFALSYLLNFIPIIGSLAFFGILVWNHVNI
ncbi:MAG: hypothetical protein EAZ72_04750, partial [Verrucomicrobia bacterium]